MFKTRLKGRTALILAAVFTLSLAACGGGGGGSNDQPTLAVSFNYGSAVEGYDLWVAMEQAPTLQGLDGHTPVCSVSAGSLPSGVAIERDSCNLSGTPTEVGDFSFTVKLTVAGFSGSVEASGTMSVRAPSLSYLGQPLTGMLGWNEASTSTPSWVGYRPNAGDSIGNFRVEDANLPAGLSIDSDTGVVSGTFIGFGTAGFTIHATITHDGKSVDVSSPIIEPTSSPPSVAYDSINAASGHVGTAYSLAAPRFSDGSSIGSPYTAVFTVELQSNWACSEPQPLPAGLTLDSATGKITGTPTEAFSGCVAVKYEVTAPGGSSVSGYDRAPVWIYS